MRRDHRIRAGLEQPHEERRVRTIHLGLVAVGDLARLAVGALAQADLHAALDQPLDVGGGPIQVRLHGDADAAGIPMRQAPAGVDGEIGVPVILHVERQGRPGFGGTGGDHRRVAERDLGI